VAVITNAMVDFIDQWISAFRKMKKFPWHEFQMGSQHCNQRLHTRLDGDKVLLACWCQAVDAVKKDIVEGNW
jgi:hypothetical protein